MKQAITAALDVLGDIAAILICAAILLPSAREYLSSRFRPDSAGGPKVGDHFPKLPGIAYDDAKATVALFLNTRCVACIQSLPDYRQLANEMAKGHQGARIVGIFGRESREQIAEYQALGFSLPMIQVTDFGAYKVSGTPTIVVVDNQGKVKDLWVGRLTSQVTNNLLNLIKEVKNVS